MTHGGAEGPGQGAQGDRGHVSLMSGAVATPRPHPVSLTRPGAAELTKITGTDKQLAALSQLCVMN